jgi:hypothetical protein
MHSVTQKPPNGFDSEGLLQLPRNETANNTSWLLAPVADLVQRGPEEACVDISRSLRGSRNHGV